MVHATLFGTYYGVLIIEIKQAGDTEIKGPTVETIA